MKHQKSLLSASVTHTNKRTSYNIILYQNSVSLPLKNSVNLFDQNYVDVIWSQWIDSGLATYANCFFVTCNKLCIFLG